MARSRRELKDEIYALRTAVIRWFLVLKTGQTLVLAAALYYVIRHRN